ECKKDTRILIEKRTVIRLLIGYAYAVKNYLREEEGEDFKDEVKPFISNIKSDLPGFKHLTGESQKTEGNVTKFLDIFSVSNKKKPHQREHINNYNLPLEISLYISDYITTQFRLKRIGVPLSNNLIVNVNLLTDCLSSFERILSTPIPLAYSIHLSQTVWIYCLSLPFQLVGLTGWSNIVIVFLATFILLGIERIAAEIENPFGTDPNDLNLDLFCKTLEEEIKKITSQKNPPNVNDWVFNEENHPFGSQEIDALHAKDLPFERIDSLSKKIDIDTKSVNEDKVSIDIDN
ncbi:2931_t:CDS:2, partial [Scutellospora calospora]